MKREDIIEVISGLNFWGKNQEIGIKREAYLKKINEDIEAQNIVIAITGVRRAGKTYLARQFLDSICAKMPKESTLYILLEEPKFDPFLNIDFLEEIYQAYKTFVNKENITFIVLDEIQVIPKWEKWIRSIIEKTKDVKIIITGSSSKLLSSELTTLLTGRVLTQEVYPLDLKEFLLFKGVHITTNYELITKKEKIRQLLTEYIIYGGFPQIVLENNNSLKSQLLKELFEGIVLRDVVSRHGIRDTHMAKATAELAINNFSGLISASKLRNTMVNLTGRKISPNLILKILSHLEEAFLIFQLPIFSYKVKEIKQYPKKIYCIDNGLINSVIIRYTENIGRLYENTVALTLLKQKGKTNLFYWKSGQGNEVDFVIKEGLKVTQLIQVSYNIDKKETKEREINALIKAGLELDCKDLLIITEDYDSSEMLNGHKIVFTPLWKWLLK